jgi:hypothetical protein
VRQADRASGLHTLCSVAEQGCQLRQLRGMNDRQDFVGRL